MKVRKTNERGKEIIKEAEGLRLEAYPDGKAWAVGFGTTAIDGEKVVEGMSVTQEDAERYLEQDIATAEAAVARYVKVNLTYNQFSALVSFTYNLGSGSLKESTLLKKLNKGDYAGAADEFGRWIYAGGKVLAGLVKRRKTEMELFLS
jgi:GH24 family phage-related lysozyme (muramidase)